MPSSGFTPAPSTWSARAVALIDADNHRSADTHLIALTLPRFPGIDLYFKDESTHPSGSLKHRLARSLFLYGICNGWIREGTCVVEASSGSTAVSEAYFAKLLGLPFVAVMPRTTSVDKIRAIEFYGGRCHFVSQLAAVPATAAQIAADSGGHFMDQFTYAERATDWRGNNNIAESIFSQMSREPHPEPQWIVVGAGTGGTSATIGRYIRFRGLPARVCVADPAGSVFYDYWHTADAGIRSEKAIHVEGIGREQVEPSFVRTVVDRMIRVEDARSFAAMEILSGLLHRRVGGSTGTNFAAVLDLAREMSDQGQKGAIVSLICDSGERYRQTYYNARWLEEQGLSAEVDRQRGMLGRLTGL